MKKAKYQNISIDLVPPKMMNAIIKIKFDKCDSDRDLQTTKKTSSSNNKKYLK
jgi:hypothetical protein